MHFAPIFDEAAQMVQSFEDIDAIVEMYTNKYGLDVVEAGELFVALSQLV